MQKIVNRNFGVCGIVEQQGCQGMIATGENVVYIARYLTYLCALASLPAWGGQAGRWAGGQAGGRKQAGGVPARLFQTGWTVVVSGKGVVCAGDEF